METIKVVVYRVGKPKEEIEIKDDLKEYQNIVGGYIQAVYFPDELVLICNEEGRLNGLKPNCTLSNGESIVGDFLVCKITKSGDFASISEEGVKKVEKYLKFFK